MKGATNRSTTFCIYPTDLILFWSDRPIEECRRNGHNLLDSVHGMRGVDVQRVGSLGTGHLTFAKVPESAADLLMRDFIDRRMVGVMDFANIGKYARVGGIDGSGSDILRLRVTARSDDAATAIKEDTLLALMSRTGLSSLTKLSIETERGCSVLDAECQGVAGYVRSLPNLLCHDSILDVYTRPVPALRSEPVGGTSVNPISGHVVGIRFRDSQPDQVLPFLKSLRPLLTGIGSWELRGRELPPADDATAAAALIQIHLPPVEEARVMEAARILEAKAESLRTEPRFDGMDATVYKIMADNLLEHIIRRIR